MSPFIPWARGEWWPNNKWYNTELFFRLSSIGKEKIPLGTQVITFLCGERVGPGTLRAVCSNRRSVSAYSRRDQPIQGNDGYLRWLLLFNLCAWGIWHLIHYRCPTIVVQQPIRCLIWKNDLEKILWDDYVKTRPWIWRTVNIEPDKNNFLVGFLFTRLSSWAEEGLLPVLPAWGRVCCWAYWTSICVSIQ